MKPSILRLVSMDFLPCCCHLLCDALLLAEEHRPLACLHLSDFQLDYLPASVRRLRLRYDSQNRTLSVPCLPDHVTWYASAFQMRLA
jgi:UDP-N-acetylmuramoylalanine-D-glutamate ligase